MRRKKLIFIVGPTAIGKTSLSIELAKILNTEIISCDSRQLYKELLIGAAPPSKNELTEVKHHFIQNISVTNEYNAGKFEVDAIKLITKLHQKKDIIIAVGGSGLYVDAICKGFDNIPEIPIKLRQKINKEFKEKGKKWLQKEVQKVDSDFYTNCDKNNSQRLLRALEVFRGTKKTISSFKTKKIKQREFEIIKIGLDTQREILYRRINNRVDNMLKQGLTNEVYSLKPYQETNALQSVGYKELFQYHNNEVTLETAVENIKRNTRRFAKRQITWFRKDKGTEWFEPNQKEEIKKFIGL